MQDKILKKRKKPSVAGCIWLVSRIQWHNIKLDVTSNYFCRPRGGRHTFVFMCAFFCSWWHFQFLQYKLHTVSVLCHGVPQGYPGQNDVYSPLVCVMGSASQMILSLRRSIIHSGGARTFPTSPCPARAVYVCCTSSIKCFMSVVSRLEEVQVNGRHGEFGSSVRIRNVAPCWWRKWRVCGRLAVLRWIPRCVVKRRWGINVVFVTDGSFTSHSLAICFHIYWSLMSLLTVIVFEQSQSRHGDTQEMNEFWC